MGGDGDSHPGEERDGDKPVPGLNYDQTGGITTPQELHLQQQEEHIEELTSVDIPTAVEVYRRGVAAEVPPGPASQEQVLEKLGTYKCIVHKTNDTIDGLVTYEEDEERLLIRFICTDVPGKGIGTKLMGELARLAKEMGVRRIFSTVSTWDERAMDFYKKCGFVEYEKEMLEEVDGKPFYISKVSATPEEVLKSCS